MKRRAKIICTLGPAVDSLENMRKLAEAGMNVARLNFSHGHHADFAVTIENLRKVEREIKRPLGILADVQGPKIRVGKLPGGQLELKEKMIIWITSQASTKPSDRIEFATDYRDFVKDVNPGNTVLFDDGLMAVKVIDKTSDSIKCEVINGGLLKERKGINVPEAPFSARSITEKDYEDILFCMDQGVDFIALSFVRTAQEVRHLKHFIESRKKNIQVIAKIEKPDALHNLDEIIDASDGILVARGDLAVEVGNERVPALQKKIVRHCHLRGKTVIIATQMLMSMVESPRPSRAEASDVANAVVDGADALMLSNETAVGKYPFEAVGMMAKIIEEMEHFVQVLPTPAADWVLNPSSQLSMALLQSACRLATVVPAHLLATVTQSGRSALLASKCRPQCPIYAITGTWETYHQLSLAWGVEVIWMEDMEKLFSQTTVFDAIGQRLQSLKLCRSEDKIVITAGLPRLAHGSTNTIKVHQV